MLKQNIKNNKKRREKIKNTSTISTLSILTLRRDILIEKIKNKKKRKEKGRKKEEKRTLSLSLPSPLCFQNFPFFLLFSSFFCPTTRGTLDVLQYTKNLACFSSFAGGNSI